MNIWVPLLLAGLAVCAVVVGGFGKRAQGKRSEKPRYVRRRFMTAREYQFFVLLRSVLPDAEIHSQVAMAALVDVQGGGRSSRNAFDRKIYDYVVCRSGGEVLYAIELDDGSHVSAGARRRDGVKDEISAAVGLRVVRYRSVNTDAFELRRDFDALASVSTGQTVTG
ncbi:DUF2726 domain-containing protein [Burkholderia sp. Ac-20384]|uniref:DUF2726 domain-containing protein n=1 Tax=Burkholderia sp. Ac-20384 TaxID=2703902 RepID=UPI001980BFBF|nr:DUF2726 domain-containing protein [Burkholderia sp. Ac-20384]MBN3829765.1 DUF2726 domain-containing protein [Burkholderia sp. Ac-20384]